MAESVIKVENLSKRFIISHEIREPYRSLRDSLTRGAKKILTRTPAVQHTQEEFWALKDLTFEIKQGDRVGIIGRNGAGKSTLLKILSRITEPTTGRITIDGRVASLLEVGTGFHPELTGRENIFLNGAILGMSRAEIRSKFDEMVAFAEVEKFLDTPVKRYSSGMYVRLAFAVAAHLEPEILIVDEVLAVGDAQFQKKCLGKMEDVSKNEGRTVLFVSHNMTAVKSICSKAVLLENGLLSKEGTVDRVIKSYQDSYTPQAINRFNSVSRKFGNEQIRFDCILVENDSSNGVFEIDKPLAIILHLTNFSVQTPINVNIFFNTIDGVNIFAVCSSSRIRNAGSFNLKCMIPANFLNDNTYSISVMAVTESRIIFEISEALIIEGIEPARDLGWQDKFPGYIRPTEFEWIEN
ncbi:MAG: ATP-binding cassette domain-containing protein [Bacteroidetes bacterium]|nr:ATP-binding cassette domain-containing protein [Bacteroidota bacterium]